MINSKIHFAGITSNFWKIKQYNHFKWYQSLVTLFSLHPGKGDRKATRTTKINLETPI